MILRVSERSYATLEWSNNTDDCEGGGRCAKIALSRRMERCNQRLTETHVSNITHYGIGHFQARNVARNTFLAVTHMPHSFAA
jgi:hypothetical protein